MNTEIPEMFLGSHAGCYGKGDRLVEQAAKSRRSQRGSARYFKVFLRNRDGSVVRALAFHNGGQDIWVEFFVGFRPARLQGFFFSKGSPVLTSLPKNVIQSGNSG